MFKNHPGQIGPGAEKQGMPVRNHSGVTGQQVKAHHDDGIDKNSG